MTLPDSIVTAVGSAVVGPGQRIVVWSRSAETLFGYPAEEVLGCPPAMLFDASDKTLARRKNGTTFAAGVTIDRGEGGLSVMTFRDLSQALTAESQRIECLRRVAATMAHEFNNVMMGVGTYVEVLKRRKNNDSLDRATRGIESSVKRGRSITDEILRYTRASKPVLATIDVGAWLAGFTAEAQAITGGVATIRSEPGLTIRGDVSQLNQVLVNLLLNAHDASPAGAPITIEAARASNEKFVEIVVADQGSGIAPENLERIFDPLFTTKPRGTGLGLAVVHQVVTAHGGVVRVESAAGSGTEFHLLLPAAE